MSDDLLSILREGADKTRIEAFLHGNQFPLVDGNNITFVWRGEAEQVLLRHWIYGLSSTMAFTRLPGSDLWYHVTDFPDRSRIEYKLEVHRNGGRELLLDPLNPNRAHDPFGANSVCQSSGYEAPDWAEPDPEARQGTMETLHFKSDALGDVRTVRVYLPARFRKRTRHPLLIAHDGDDYLRFSVMQTVLDNLIHRLELPPLIVALTNPHNRLEEYAAHEPHADFIAKELLPELENRYPIHDRPEQRALMGASFGAISALYTSWKHQGLFGNLLLQSGSFGFTDIGDHQRGPAFDPVVKFMNEFRRSPGKPTDRLFMSCGTYESLIYENRSMVPFFQSTGMDVRYVEARDGHNWENWRDRMREGLSWVFPGPLWMIYE